MTMPGSWSGSTLNRERRDENGEAWCVCAAMREIRERSAGVTEDACPATVSGGLVKAVDRKNGALVGACGGSIGLFRCRIVSRLRRVCQRDCGTRERVRREECSWSTGDAIFS